MTQDNPTADDPTRIACGSCGHPFDTVERMKQHVQEWHDISLCENGCHCMTHTLADGTCGKCGSLKDLQADAKLDSNCGRSATIRDAELDGILVDFRRGIASNLTYGATTTDFEKVALN